jgi:hypothetical protein
MAPSRIDRTLSCPRCERSLTVARPTCPYCAFTLVEDGVASPAPLAALSRLAGPFPLARPKRPRAAIALLAATAAALALLALPAPLAPASKPLTSAEVEGRLALRYPALQHAEHAVIACPDHPLKPGGRTGCWILARVGLQRGVVVRLSPRGDELRFQD